MLTANGGGTGQRSDRAGLRNAAAKFWLAQKFCVADRIVCQTGVRSFYCLSAVRIQAKDHRSGSLGAGSGGRRSPGSNRFRSQPARAPIRAARATGRVRTGDDSSRGFLRRSAAIRGTKHGMAGTTVSTAHGKTNPAERMVNWNGHFFLW